MARTAIVTMVLCGLLWLVASGACAAAPWYIRAVDSAGDVGGPSSIALDARGYAHISYEEFMPNWDLKYAA